MKLLIFTISKKQKKDNIQVVFFILLKFVCFWCNIVKKQNNGGYNKWLKKRKLSKILKKK